MEVIILGVIFALALIYFLPSIARSLNHNRHVASVETFFVFIYCAVGFMLVTWLMSGAIMVPLEWGYNKVGGIVFAVPAIVVITISFAYHLTRYIHRKIKATTSK